MNTGFSILNNKHPHESFSAARELESRLAGRIRGEVRFDAGSRALYSTDGSNYRQTPIGIVLPRDIADVQATMEICRELGAPVLSRGGGTSLAGQCCNVAVVLDFSKYMRNIVSLDPESRLAVVEPGIVLDRVREAAERHELTFAPDPATHSRCTLGGMIGNNSCGTHALMGGKTVDNIHSLDILLYDGTRMTVGKTSDEEFSRIVSAGGRKGQIYAGLARIRDRYGKLVRERFPDIPRRVSGYNLDELLPENGFHVARALVGSEGTCVTILNATLDLKPSPQCRRLVVVGFPDAFVAADHVPKILEHNPIGLEGFDSTLTGYMRLKGLALDDIKLLPPGDGFLLVEFGAWNETDVLEQAERFIADMNTLPSRPSTRLYSEAEAPHVWHVRESALGATVFVPGQAHHWEGWEDSAVPPAQLGSYLRQLYKLMDSYGYDSAMYGHFGQGCVHMRINFDLESTQGIAKYREFIDKATDIVIAHGGSISGEHGDGQSRAALLPKMFGPELMQAFQEFKALWDPTNSMNPGKLIDPVAVYDPTENLRLGAGYEAHPRETFFQFPDDKGSLSEATLRCVGVGACRKAEAGTMCPSYMATQEEQHSTRGRAHLLWEMLDGDLLSKGNAADWQNEAVHEALDLCLSCKACKNECPVNVDMATYKSEFLAHYYDGHRRPLRHYAFGFMDKWARMASAIPGVTPQLANLPMSIPGLSHAIKAVLGIAPERTLPRFAPRSFSSFFKGSKAENKPPVLLWPDTWNNYYHPQTLGSAQSVLTTAGFDVRAPKGHVCCGRPLYDFGFLKEAREYLVKIMGSLSDEIESGMPIVFLEPSCASVFRDELINFFPNDPKAKRLREQTYLLSDFLLRHAPGYKPEHLAGKSVLLHGHCHQKSATKMASERELLSRGGAEVTVLDSGCCGMAGPFGFEAEKFEISQSLAERRLLPAFRTAPEDTLLVSDGFSCREQVSQNRVRPARHLAEVLDNNR
ncbi:FAD-binding and (Fe-S)-binding domain-containing protein [Silvibacterium acidisoli]|uniref:FAD-binding and (Fe-S)-binding domain-containing protein n=1 Tax=Acidobacteriaceae bacterium ZG23-2 TaxID=2883246 RepID=UPI00406D3D76